MLMKKKYVTSLFFLFTFLSFSQVADSIKYSLQQRPRLTADLSGRYTFIDGFERPVTGVKAGLDFNDLVRMGFAYSFLKKPYHTNIIILNSSGQKEILNADLKFQYWGVYFEYVFQKTHKWEFSIPLQLSAGSSQTSYSVTNILNINKAAVYLYEPAISGCYRIKDWFGLSGLIGYRFMHISDKAVSAKVNGPLYAFGATIFWRTLYRKHIKEKLKSK